MKYIKGYKRFVNESKIAIEKNALIVEKQVLEDFSSDFWNLCLRSAVFTEEEKYYIKESLSLEKVSLVKEEWGWLDKAVDWAKEKGEKMLDFVSGKIKALKDGIKSFVSSMVSIAKTVLIEGMRHALSYATEAKKKFAGDAKIKKAIGDIDPKKSENEFEDLKKTFQHWAPGKTAAEAKPKLDQFGGTIEAKLKTAESEAISSSTKNLEEAEKEIAQGQNESVSSILSSTSDDVLMSFYNLSLVKEADAAAAEQKGGAGEWLLGFLGQESLDPDAKLGKKLFWWGKLFLKILSTCLSPVLKIVEAAVKAGANKVLKGVSVLTAAMGGPGAFEFAVLGGLCGGIVGLIYDTLMLFGSHAAGTGTFGAVKKWLAHAINDALEIFPDFMTLKYIFAGFCAGMTLWHVYEEIKHLAHGGHGHDEHGKEGDHAEEKTAAPTKPGTPEAEKTAAPAKPEAQAKPEAPKPGAPAPAAPAQEKK